MARGKNQKLKLLYLAKFFMEETDDEHGLSLREIVAKLESFDIHADRKTLYSDFEDLRTFGMDIFTTRTGNDWRYHLGTREFELAELKLLVDSVQSAKFITEKKSQALIKKLESLVSRYEAKQLHRQVLISGRVKTMNESIYYNVDKIHAAINADSRIKFQYFQWNVKKEMVLRHNGAWYEISPLALVWNEENYYMIGYDTHAEQTKHFRVDKMLRISVTGTRREEKKELNALDIPAYSRRLFGMFAGEQTFVSLEGHSHLAPILIDRFGKDILLFPQNDELFTARISVSVSPQFLGWIISLGPDIRITGPEHVLAMMRQVAQRLTSQYPSL